MASDNKTEKDAEILLLASAQLINAIRNAVTSFYASPPQGWNDSDRWRTPKPWEERVLPNLKRYHEELEAAFASYLAGNLMPLTLVASSYAGLSKDLDFDMSWMTDECQQAVKTAVEAVVLVADAIHRAGYEALEKDNSFL